MEDFGLEMRVRNPNFDTVGGKKNKEKKEDLGYLRLPTDYTDLPSQTTSRCLESSAWFNHISEDYKEALKSQG